MPHTALVDCCNTLPKRPVDEEIKLVTQKTPQQIQSIMTTAANFPMKKIVARYIKDHGVSTETAAVYERELKRFLTVCVIYGGPIGMRGPVDELWHTFLMFTEDYARFCELVAGTFMHHMPNDEETSKEDRRKAALRFNAAYAAVFGADPDLKVWPLLADGDCDTGFCHIKCGLLGDVICWAAGDVERHIS